MDFYELVRKQQADCPPEVMDAEDPLYILIRAGPGQTQGRGGMTMVDTWSPITT